MTIQIVSVVQQIAWLLLAAAVLGMAAHWLRVPYAVVLVLGGLLVGASHAIAVPRLEPTLLLFVFLPPLLFDASFRFNNGELRGALRPILVLALPGTVLTALGVGVILRGVLGLPLPEALVFGTLVAATDPVAVVGIFHRLRVPGRLGAIVEGESLINDGIAITLYTAVIALALGRPLSGAETGVFFLQQVLGGVVVGSALGFLVSRLAATIDDHLVEMTLSTALAYGSYVLTQSLGASGALACVMAGLIHGSYGRQIGMSASTRHLLDELWEYLGFLANGFVFLLVGFSVDLGSLGGALWPVAVAIGATLLMRLVVVLGLTRLVPRPYVVTTRGERMVLIWGGLRGALTVALALAVPSATPYRDLLVTMAFGVVLFTLVVQGVSIPLVIRRVGLARST